MGRVTPTVVGGLSTEYVAVAESKLNRLSSVAAIGVGSLIIEYLQLIFVDTLS